MQIICTSLLTPRQHLITHFAGQMLLLTPCQRYESTECNYMHMKHTSETVEQDNKAVEIVL